MSRNIEFFHGTNKRFAPGNLILPRNLVQAVSPWEGNEYLAPEHNQGDVAYATSNMDAAQSFADHAAKMQGGEPIVYKVEPVDHSDLSYDYAVQSADAYTSKKGFRVLNEVKPK